MEKNLTTKDDLLNKLRAYAITTDDENTQYKNIIKNVLINSPELLYALHETQYEYELFTEDGKINWDEETHEPLGEWDLYYGANSNIRPFLFIPTTQTDIKHYICYEVAFDTFPKWSSDGFVKKTEITFTIFVHGDDAIDALTGIPRHDLIASIIREKFNWSSIFGYQTKLISSKESVTDSKYLTREIIFEVNDLNDISVTPYNGETYIRNNEYWK